MSIIHANGFEERLIRRGPRDSLSERCRFTAYYNLINNNPHSNIFEQKLRQAANSLIRNKISRALRIKKEEEILNIDRVRDQTLRSKSLNRVSYRRFAEYDRGFNILTNKAADRPVVSAKYPASCFDTLFR
jgi:hypothetical protein